MIRSLYAARGFENALSGLVISSTGFTSDAKVCANDSGIGLMDICTLMPWGLEHDYEAIFFCDEKDTEHMDDRGQARAYVFRVKDSILTPKMEVSVDRGAFMPLENGLCCIATKRPHVFEIRIPHVSSFRYAPRTSKNRIEMDVNIRNGRPHVSYELERYNSPVSTNRLQ